MMTETRQYDEGMWTGCEGRVSKKAVLVGSGCGFRMYELSVVA